MNRLNGEVRIKNWLAGVLSAIFVAAILSIAAHMANAEFHEREEVKLNRIRVEQQKFYQETIKPDLLQMEIRLKEYMRQCSTSQGGK